MLRYFDHVLPVRPGTVRLPLTDLLDAQHYRLADWHLAATELNWRRFFDISSLIAVRVEDPAVFEATHEVILRLVAEGLIDGLRVDHPDGLADPRGYLRRLADRTGGLWVSTEKILSGHEELPADWPCAGTTGYDALGVVGGLFLDPAGAEPLTAAYQRLTTGPGEFAGVARDAKREEAGQALAAEVSRLARLAGDAGHPDLDGLSVSERAAVLVELLTAMPVYRAYVVPGEPAPPRVGRDRGRGRRGRPGAAAGAAASGPGRRGQPGPGPRCCRWPARPADRGVPAGLRARDGQGRRGHRVLPLVPAGRAERGGRRPGAFGTSPAEFHEFAARLARDWPATMTTLSTHDTKRQEDVRARLAVLAEIPEAWAAEVARWHERAAALASGAVPEPDTEYLMWQTLAGGWPLDRERLTGYLRKAMREAKSRTSWTDPDPEYESQVLTFAELVLEDEELTGQIGRFVTGLAGDAGANALGAKLVQLTMPGVADTYQGCELAGLRLVDPDNRGRPTSPVAGTCWPRWMPVTSPPAWIPVTWTRRSCWSRP